MRIQLEEARNSTNIRDEEKKEQLSEYESQNATEIKKLKHENLMIKVERDYYRSIVTEGEIPQQERKISF